MREGYLVPVLSWLLIRREDRGPRGDGDWDGGDVICAVSASEVDDIAGHSAWQTMMTNPAFDWIATTVPASELRGYEEHWDHLEGNVVVVERGRFWIDPEMANKNLPDKARGRAKGKLRRDMPLGGIKNIDKAKWEADALDWSDLLEITVDRSTGLPPVDIATVRDYRNHDFGLNPDGSKLPLDQQPTTVNKRDWVGWSG